VTVSTVFIALRYGRGQSKLQLTGGRMRAVGPGKLAMPRSITEFATNPQAPKCTFIKADYVPPTPFNGHVSSETCDSRPPLGRLKRSWNWTGDSFRVGQEVAEQFGESWALACPASSLSDKNGGS
jgi:hypothetical protein